MRDKPRGRVVRTPAREGEKHIKRNLIAGLVAGLCVAAASVVVGGTQASAHPEDCPDGYVCVWGDSNYEGRFLFVPGTDRANVGSAMNDLTTSIWNRTGSRVCFYDDANYGGSILAIVNAGAWRGNVGPTANDRISSWRAC
ncbi:peptidase inhibitor family I36 protein [Streptomyces sulfonofaciens]|uniref:peptidase inhibitor family I36 protein n=1 Tax=Streptomyces sulfonofaciens TaxID=68272 RepID=UPI001674E3A3|nr:peptidase inhibitor family I36 protein [Streptomyces sulfonofaciens]